MFVNEVVHYWFIQYPWSGPSPDDVADQLLARVGDLVESEGRLLPGARWALDLAGERGPLAIASSTPRALIVRCLEHFDLLDRFASIHSAENRAVRQAAPGRLSQRRELTGRRAERVLGS